jgi:hypothetical protein
MLRSIGYVHASYINYVNVETKLRTLCVRSLVSNNINNDNIKTDFKKVVWDDVDRTDVVHSRDTWRAFVNTAMKHLVP